MKWKAVEQKHRLVVRVGVTGHRKLDAFEPDALRKGIRTALDTVSDVTRRIRDEPDSGYLMEPPVIRVISPLAEGGDRLVAQLAKDHGLELQCPIPFFKEEYKNDFPESTKEFDEIANAAPVLELDGARDSSSHAYQTVGRIMLEHSDLVIAIWDGQDPKGRGGTGQIVREAIAQSIPTLHIAPQSPDEPRLLVSADPNPTHSPAGTGLKIDLTERLRPVLTLSPPLPKPRIGWLGRFSDWLEHDPDISGDYAFQKYPHRTLLGSFWGGFITVMLWLGGERQEKLPRGPSPEPDPFGPHYRTASGPANYFVKKYRGSFLLNYVLGILAVLFALLVYALPALEVIWVVAELGMIGGILWNIIVARRRFWHRRSIDSRFFAEQFRQMQFLHTTARTIPLSRPPPQYAFGDPRGTWMSRRFRAIVREVGMPTKRFNRAHLDESWDLIRNGWVEGQILYHKKNAREHETVDHVLHRIAWILFFSTAVICLLHFFIHGVPWLTVATAWFPACGAAAHAIASQGEFHRLAERSQAMTAQLEQIAEELDDLKRKKASFTSTELNRIVSSAAQIMIDEVSEWRILYRKPPLPPA